MKRNCGITGCDGNGSESWIDLIDDGKDIKDEDRPFGRVGFCKKHFNQIFPYIQKKEQEDIEKWAKEHPNGKKTKDGHTTTKIGWAFAPLSLVNKALKQ